MNFLAHSFLSFTEGQVVGNMIADYIRNADVKNLPQEIQDGVFLHRQIDTFTDAHPETHKAKKVFLPLVRLYAGAFTDVSMDYFLANDLRIKTKNEWEQHSQRVYQILEKYLEFVPQRFQSFLVKMETEDWLFNYRNDWGIDHSMQNVLYKAKYLNKNIPVFQAFLKQKDFLQTCYDRFFPDLHDFASKTAKNL